MSLIKWQEEAGQITLGLPEDLDLGMASALVDSLRHALTVGDSVIVMADVVERISTATIQALLAASRLAQHNKQRFVIIAPSGALSGACRDLGLSSWLEQWSRA